MIEKKVNKITKLSELNKLNSSTTKKLYEYNIIYGHNSNNIIKSYTPKLIQFGSKFKKKVDKGEKMIKKLNPEQEKEFKNIFDIDNKNNNNISEFSESGAI